MKQGPSRGPTKCHRTKSSRLGDLTLFAPPVKGTVLTNRNPEVDLSNSKESRSYVTEKGRAVA